MARGEQSDEDMNVSRSRIPDLEPERLLQELQDGGVQYVLIGGFAALLRGSPDVTEDVDITPLRETSNLTRLAEVLRGIDAVALTPAGDDEPDWPIDDQHLRLRDTTQFRTRHGLLDVVINPAAADGYPDLINDSDAVDLPGGPSVFVLRLGRIIKSKRASDRPKDRAALPGLERLLSDDESGS